MDGRDTVLKLTLRSAVEQRDDRWVIKCFDGMAIVVYGLTQKEAEDSFLGAVEAVVDSYKSNEDLERWLKANGIMYEWEQGSTGSRPSPSQVMSAVSEERANYVPGDALILAKPMDSVVKVPVNA